MKKNLLPLTITQLLASTSSAYYQAEQGRWLSRDPIGERGRRSPPRPGRSGLPDADPHVRWCGKGPFSRFGINLFSDL
jgi:hypothetical protein